MTQSTTTAGRPAEAGTGQPARAGRAETVRFAATHALPELLRGCASRRTHATPPWAALTRPHWSAATLRAMRARHGGAPVLVRGLSGTLLVLLDPQELHQFYAGSGTAPAPKTPRTREDRREIDDAVLASGSAVHPSYGPFLAVIAEEARRLTAPGTLRLTGARHAAARAGRRMVLGEAAAGDEELTGWLSRSRSAGAWTGLRTGRTRAARELSDKVAARIGEYARHAEPYTLVGRARRHADPTGALDPTGQARHWLHAMDTVPATLLRTLLLLAAHPAEQDLAAAEARAADAASGELPRLRACVRESLRLYPVVADLIRVTHAETEWRGVRHPAGTAVLLPALFHQRDPDHVPAAHVFVPGRWSSHGAHQDVRMAPFSHGAGRCPGDQLGLLVVAAFCARLLRTHRVRDGRPALDPMGPLPTTLDPRGIRLRLAHR
ncbi:cytochrome P450 [Streptomyces sp. NPDC046557]|uniref:cytochrome P450 n=1 Tax=Streptomyces sp. NPDC046557 TaxID=3155372 RepID=UPI0033FAF775